MNILTDMIATALMLLLISTDLVSSLTITMSGGNVYNIKYRGEQYFLFIPQKEATITCSVTGADSTPHIQFYKEGELLDTVLPDSLYKLQTSSSGQTHSLKLIIDAMYTGGYTKIEGTWSCAAQDGSQDAKSTFKTLCTGKPTIDYYPALVRGVAREGTTITLQCNCEFLDTLQGNRTWSWLINSASPAGSRISYIGSIDGYPSDKLVINKLDSTDTAEYACGCKVARGVEFFGNSDQLSVMRPPGKPTLIQLESTTMSSLTIKWQNSDNMGVVVEYKISYKKRDSSSYKELSTGTSRRDYTITGLDSLTDYHVKITALNNAGSGLYSDVSTFTTDKPSESIPDIVTADLTVTDDNYYLYETSAGMNVALTCVVTSYPAPMLTWFYNSQEIPQGDPDTLQANYDQTIEKKTNFKTKYVLHINSASRSSDGIYTCVATNTEGSTELIFDVQVTHEDNSAEENRSGGTTKLYSISLPALISLFLLLCR